MPNAFPVSNAVRACLLRFLLACAGIAAALATVACGSSSPLAATSPSPVNLPPRPVPSIAEISVSRGSTEGGTQVTIRGSNLTGGGVAFGNAVKVFSIGFNPREEPGTSLFLVSPPHAPGVVDLVVTTVTGVGRLDGAFEYVDPQAFDFNGKWGGFTTDGSDVWIEFVIKNNTVVSWLCDGTTTQITTRPADVDVTAGGFLAPGPNGFHLAGRIVSAGQATGKVTGPDCKGAGESPWQAYKVN